MDGDPFGEVAPAAPVDAAPVDFPMPDPPAGMSAPDDDAFPADSFPAAEPMAAPPPAPVVAEVAAPATQSAMDTWNAEWTAKLTARKSAENAAKAEAITAALADAAKFNTTREKTRESKMQKNRNEEQVKLEALEADLESVNPWERVVKLVDLQQVSCRFKGSSLNVSWHALLPAPWLLTPLPPH